MLGKYSGLILMLCLLPGVSCKYKDLPWSILTSVGLFPQGLTCPTGSKAVPPGFVGDPRTPNKFYKPVTTGRKFFVAKAMCRYEGADLPNLDTQAEYEVIRDFES